MTTPVSDNQEINRLQARVEELEKINAKLRSDVRLQALDRALEFHRRAWSTDKQASPEDIKITTEAFEKIILGSVNPGGSPGSGVQIENFPADVCPECKTGDYAHAAGCLIGHPSQPYVR